MGRYERSIRIAFEKLTGEILEANELFTVKTEGFEIRKLYHTGELPLSCCECEQDLVISSSKYDRLHFKHKPGHDYCILAEGKLTPQEHEKFTEILKAKESARHKELKNKIGNLLRNVDGVECDSIAIDNKYIIKNDGRRKPDVYCRFQNREIVFEIQLSQLSLGYIFSRYEFYKHHGIYLIWILDSFDIHNQGTLERDIKYLAKHQNFFKLDELADDFKFECEFKYSYLTSNNKLLTKWQKRSVSLPELKFDNDDVQVYFHHFENNRYETEQLQLEKLRALKQAEKIKQEGVRLEKAQRTAIRIKEMIRKNRGKPHQSFDEVFDILNSLDNFEVNVLNEFFNLKDKVVNGNTPLVKWINEANQDDIPFIEFILECDVISIDRDVKFDTQRTAFQAILMNSNIHYRRPIISLFKSGYILTSKDRSYLDEYKLEHPENAANVVLFELCNKLRRRELVEQIFEFSKLLFIIESAKTSEMIFFSFGGNKWISFANNAIQYYGEYWDYIEQSFKKYGVWDKLIEIDSKFTFQKKISHFYSNTPKQNRDFDEVFHDLYNDFEVLI